MNAKTIEQLQEEARAAQVALDEAKQKEAQAKRDAELAERKAKEQRETDVLAARLAPAINAVADGLRAAGVQIGTAYLSCPESTISPAFRAALEKQLGTRLFARSTDGLSLTSHGRKFREHAEAMAAAMKFYQKQFMVMPSSGFPD